MVVGPRTPFAQDPLLDYSYDSGDDWEDEEGGDDVDGAEAAENQPEEEDEEEEDSEGEFDDWLDDSEDAGYDPANAMEVDEDGSADRALEQGRLAMKVTAKKQKEAPPKKVVKLVPSWKGPEWEPQFGSGTEGMEQYRLQLLNGKFAIHWCARVACARVADPRRHTHQGRSLQVHLGGSDPALQSHIHNDSHRHPSERQNTTLRRGRYIQLVNSSRQRSCRFSTDFYNWSRFK